MDISSCPVRARVASDCGPGGVCESVRGAKVSVRSALPGSGSDAPSPAELLMMSVLHCVGMIACQRFSGLEAGVRRLRSEALFDVSFESGVEAIDATYEVEGDILPAVAEQILREAEAASPMLKTLAAGIRYRSKVAVTPV